MSLQLSSAQTQLSATFQSQADRTTRYLVKCRAQAYAERPVDLDAIATGLSGAAPETLIAVGADLLRIEARTPKRWFGFGSETAALNARALMLLGRTLRRFGAPRKLVRPVQPSE
ncbi:hypothetical protein [Methylocella tundrae]|uniref:Uncharacterized protein n=1 Tax=Methylocella tundrae TaxID=227605 RepID=A0A4U8Z494_METTU|nr:hypothetical protein [Methylocella tundrae]WPP04013.1 hypothetical protein SIN04_16370 [Methylocella tundrae]VFU10239.1 conserved protein of unknown function [Methylocella tundrae]